LEIGAVLVRCSRLTHGGDQQRVDIQEVDLASATDDDQLLAVSEALDKLSAQHKTEAELVKLPYFVGMTNDEAAEALGIAPRTAKYYWTHARAWLFREIDLQCGSSRRTSAR
jgi:DNA-directed RNA polymerase specialized sigma24 family protein